MKKILVLFLLIVVIRANSQSISVSDLKQILSPEIKVEDYLNSITPYCIKYSKKLKNGETIALISIDTLITKGGKKPVSQPPFSLIYVSLKSKGLVYSEETEGRNNFKFLADITISDAAYVIFYHLSSIGDYLEYFIVDSNTGKWYKIGPVTENIRIDYVSFDFLKEGYIYYLGTTEDKKYGKFTNVEKSKR